MIYDNGEQGLEAVLFPVDEVDVYAETEPSRKEKVPQKKALVNTDTRKVLKIVGKQYQVLHNRDALRLAERCCIMAFPNTAPANWGVFRVEAPKTGGHCRIDLSHKGKIPTYDWSFSRSAQDRYEPFVRVTNSYNGKYRFTLNFGLVRFKCTNGIVVWDSSATISFAHDDPDIERRIERKIDEAKYRKSIEDYHQHMDTLRKVGVRRSFFRSVIQSALRIQKPKNLPQDRESDWASFAKQLDDIADKYITELGENGEALINTITDVASHPPRSDGFYNFIRQESHHLQSNAGRWLAEFTSSLAQPAFDLDSYLANPSVDQLST